MACTGSCATCGSACTKKADDNKAIQEMSAITGFKYDNLRKPISAVLNVTDACNNACPYCFATESKNFMTLDTAIAAVEYIKKNCGEGQIPTIIFFGGEPMLNYEGVVKPLIEKYKNNCNWSITTNGTLLTEEVIDFFAENNVGVLLSMDGIKEVQDEARPMKNGKSSFDAIMENIHYLIMKIPSATVRATVTSISAPHIFESMKFFEKMGFKECAFCANEREEFSPEIYRVLVDQYLLCGEYIYKKLLKREPVISFNTLITAYRDLRESDYTPTFHNELDRCGMGTTAVGVSYNGNLIPCQEENTSQSMIIGDVFSGINKEKHIAYLEHYFDLMRKIDCESLCEANTRLVCYNFECPNVLIKNGGKIPQGHCVQTRALLIAAGRLYHLCGDSIFDNIRKYFKEE